MTFPISPYCLMAWLCVNSLAVAEDFSDLKPQARKPWVAEQIRKLDADTRRERAEAERALLSAGPTILAWLPPPELLPSTAVRQAVRRIQLRLEEAKARDSVKASHITLKKTASLEEVFKTIAQQTGNRLNAEALPASVRQKSVSLAISKTPFWDVMDQLALDYQFRLESQTQGNADKPALLLKPLDPKIPSPVVKPMNRGAFRVSVNPPQFRPRFGTSDEQLLRVPFQLACEPRLRPLFLNLEGKDFSARTPQGKAIPPFNPDAKLELPLGEGGTETAFHLDFQVPKPFAEPAIQLTGKAVLTVAAGSEEISFTNLEMAEGTARRRGGVTVTIKEVSFKPDEKQAHQHQAKFQVMVHYDTGGPAFESHRTWIFHNRVLLEDANGKRIERNSNFHTALQTDGGVIVEYHFDHLTGKPGDYKFLYIAPTLIINVPVSFEFKNLPIPKT